MKPNQNRPPPFNIAGTPPRPPLIKPAKASKPITTVFQTSHQLPQISDNQTRQATFVAILEILVLEKAPISQLAQTSGIDGDSNSIITSETTDQLIDLSQDSIELATNAEAQIFKYSDNQTNMAYNTLSDKVMKQLQNRPDGMEPTALIEFLAKSVEKSQKIEQIQPPQSQFPFGVVIQQKSMSNASSRAAPTTSTIKRKMPMQRFAAPVTSFSQSLIVEEETKEQNIQQVPYQFDHIEDNNQENTEIVNYDSSAIYFEENEKSKAVDDDKSLEQNSYGEKLEAEVMLLSGIQNIEKAPDQLQQKEEHEMKQNGCQSIQQNQESNQQQLSINEFSKNIPYPQNQDILKESCYDDFNQHVLDQNTQDQKINKTEQQSSQQSYHLNKMPLTFEMLKQNEERFQNVPISMMGIQTNQKKNTQSVTSTNLAVEDSESIIRAYKRKKSECDSLKNQCGIFQTELSQLRQVFESNQEELSSLKSLFQTNENKHRQVSIREAQFKAAMDTQKREIDLVKSQVNTYYNELNQQKKENNKLRKRMQELLQRQISKGQSNTTNPSSSDDAYRLQNQIDQALQKRDAEHSQQLSLLKSTHQDALMDKDSEITRLKQSHSQLRLEMSSNEQAYLAFERRSKHQEYLLLEQVSQLKQQLLELQKQPQSSVIQKNEPVQEVKQEADHSLPKNCFILQNQSTIAQIATPPQTAPPKGLSVQIRAPPLVKKPRPPMYASPSFFNQSLNTIPQEEEVKQVIKSTQDQQDMSMLQDHSMFGDNSFQNTTQNDQLLIAVEVKPEQEHNISTLMTESVLKVDKVELNPSQLFNDDVSVHYQDQSSMDLSYFTKTVMPPPIPKAPQATRTQKKPQNQTILHSIIDQSINQRNIEDQLPIRQQTQQQNGIQSRTAGVIPKSLFD